jgi:hypothetical protein
MPSDVVVRASPEVGKLEKKNNLPISSIKQSRPDAMSPQKRKGPFAGAAKNEVRLARCNS